MLELFFLIVLVWGVCFSVANPSIFEPSMLLGPVNPNGTCTNTYSCAGEGDSCMGDQFKMNGCNQTSGNCCSMGLYCLSGTCQTDNIGGACNSSLDCRPPAGAGAVAIGCNNKTCTYLYGAGEGCTVNSDCMFGLPCNNSMCVGLSVGQPCIGGGCTFGYYCPLPLNGTSVCTAQMSNGQGCSTTSQCYPGNFCFNGKCTATNSLASGASCAGAMSCVEGYTCAINNKTCVAVSTSPETCSTNSDCNGIAGSLCYCSPYTQNSYCSDALLDPCSSEKIDLQSCLIENNCSYPSAAPNSCSYTNCYSDFEDSQSCSCSLADDYYGDCFYSNYCGGFPIWAIIVIIVVAIILVLAIVLLVFFMMKRKPDYEQI